MSEAAVHLESVAGEQEAPRPSGGRVRTCVGCGEHVDVSSAVDLVRLVLAPDGAVAVDARGGGFGRGVHVHARPACLERAAKVGLARSTKGRALSILDEEGARRPICAELLARAIQQAMNRRVEGLLAAAARGRQIARGADAVIAACQRGDAALVVVACDAAAAAGLTEVRRAVASGRAVAWGSKLRLQQIVEPSRGDVGSGGAGVGVVALLSRSIAGALRSAVQVVDGCNAAHGSEQGGPRADRRSRPRRSGPDAGRAGRAASGGRAGEPSAGERGRAASGRTKDRGSDG